MSWRKTVFTGIFLGYLCGITVVGLTPARGAKQKASSSDFAAMIQKKEKMLRADLRKRKGEPWEGEFVRRTFDSSTGWLLATSGYVSRGKLMDLGTVQSIGTRLRLVSQSPFITNEDDNEGHELIVVHWDKRIYLVEAEDMIKFCNCVNSGELSSIDGPNYQFYLKREAPRGKPSGLPHVPKEFKDYLLKKPIIASVIKRHSKHDGVLIAGREFPMSGIPVTINAGSKQGVRLGMSFFPEGEPLSSTLYAISVSANKSELLFVGLIHKDDKQVRVGLKLSTQDSIYVSKPNLRQ
jgi:hypothetical protein